MPVRIANAYVKMMLHSSSRGFWPSYIIDMYEVCCKCGHMYCLKCKIWAYHEDA